MAVAAGLLFAAIAVPTVAGIGVLTKTAISKFDHMAVPKLGLLPVRSEIYDRKGHLITYYYPNGIDRVPVTYSQISPSMRKAILALQVEAGDRVDDPRYLILNKSEAERGYR